MFERLALAALVVVSVVMGYNVATTARTLGNAVETFDHIQLDLTSVEYRESDSLVDMVFNVNNPTPHPIEVLEIDFSLRANGTSVGGGNLRPEVGVAGNDERDFELAGRILQPGIVERLDREADITWSGSGRVLVSVGEELDPEWIEFVFRWAPQ